MPRLYAKGAQFDTTLREKCFPRRTRRCGKLFRLFFTGLEKLCEAFLTVLIPGGPWAFGNFILDC